MLSVTRSSNKVRAASIHSALAQGACRRNPLCIGNQVHAAPTHSAVAYVFRDATIKPCARSINPLRIGLGAGEWPEAAFHTPVATGCIVLFFAAETSGRWPHCIVQWPLQMAARIGPVGDDGIERLLPSLANGSGASYWVVPSASTNVSIQMPLSAVPVSTDEQDSLILRVAAIKPSELSSINAQGLGDHSGDLYHWYSSTARH